MDLHLFRFFFSSLSISASYTADLLELFRYLLTCSLRAAVERGVLSSSFLTFATQDSWLSRTVQFEHQGFSEVSANFQEPEFLAALPAKLWATCQNAKCLKLTPKKRSSSKYLVTRSSLGLKTGVGGAYQIFAVFMGYFIYWSYFTGNGVGSQCAHQKSLLSAFEN